MARVRRYLVVADAPVADEDGIVSMSRRGFHVGSEARQALRQLIDGVGQVAQAPVGLSIVRRRGFA